LCFLFVFLAHRIFSPDSRDDITHITVVMIADFLLTGAMIEEVKEI